MTEQKNTYEILDHFKESLWECKKRYIVEQGGAGSGKLVPGSTRIITPNGYVLMRDLRIGDTICSINGGTTKVVAKYNGCKKKTYKITFEDGRSCIAGEEHLWGVNICDASHRVDTWRVKDTENIKKIMDEYGCNVSISIPLPTPVFFNSRPLNNDCKDVGRALCEMASNRDDVSIPEKYLFTSVENRRDLAYGLCTHGGRYDENGNFVFTSTSKKFVEDFTWLIRSLGGVCEITSEKKIFRKRIYHAIQRPSAMVSPSNICSKKKLKIIDIKETIIDEDVYCIQVDHKSSLYMIEDFIVTHNTHSIIQRLCYIFLTQEDVRITVVRASMPALKRSVYLGSPSFVEMLSVWGIKIYEWLNKSESKIVNPNNSSVIEFVGLDDPEKIKSMNTNYIFIEEATELTAEKWRQLDTRMRRDNKNGPNQMFIAYNPISFSNWVVQTFVANPDDIIKENTNVHFSNFTQNNHVSVENVKTWLANASHNEEYYRTYILGIPGTPKGQIYTNFKFSPKDLWPAGVWDVKPYYGVDWGFVHPMCLTECRDFNGTTYVINRYYKSGTTTQDLIDYMKSIGINSSNPIYYDTAEADRGYELIKNGFTAYKAMKNVLAGISHMQGCNIVVDISDKNGEDALYEVQSYTWMKDPNNDDLFLEKPIKEHDDFCITGGSLITTKNGLVPMRDIHVGDFVLTRKGYRKVITHCITNPDAEVMCIKTQNHALVCTPNHRIWSEDRKRYISADALRYGEYLLASNAHVIDISRPDFAQESVVARIMVEKRQPVYNMTVKGEHEYFANGILVSNCDSLRYARFTKYMKEVEFSTGKLDLSGYEDTLKNLGMQDTGEPQRDLYPKLPI